ncbi:hypothetical protein [Microbulbifer sp. JMSA002]|uniref:hypothetical protein n=1 Tax=Microbulbifer sp. JMSA002 TaxID=3243368 RepID=UPI00403A26C2
MKRITNLYRTLLISTVLISACSGGGSKSGDSSEPTPSQSTPSTPSTGGDTSGQPSSPSAITLHGIFTEDFKDFPVVTVRIGEKEYIADQKNNNEFSVEVDSSHENELVTFSAKGSMPNDWDFEFRSYAGSFSDIKDKAINNEVSYLNNNPAFAVGTFTGVMADLIDLANNGELITSVEDLKKYTFEVPLDEAIQLAAYMKATISSATTDTNNYYFPVDKYSNTKDFIKDFQFSIQKSEDIINQSKNTHDIYLKSINYLLENKYLRDQSYKLNASEEIIFSTRRTDSDATLDTGLIELSTQHQTSGSADLSEVGKFTLSTDEFGNISGSLIGDSTWEYYIEESCVNMRDREFEAKHAFTTPYSQIVKIDFKGMCEGPDGDYESTESRYFHVTDTKLTFPWDSLPEEFYAASYHPETYQNCDCDIFPAKFTNKTESTGEIVYGVSSENSEKYSYTFDKDLRVKYEGGTEVRYIPLGFFNKTLRFIGIGNNPNTDKKKIFSGFMMEKVSKNIPTPIRLEYNAPFLTDYNYALTYKDNGIFHIETLYQEQPLTESKWGISPRIGSWEKVENDTLITKHYYDPSLDTEENGTLPYLASCEGQSEECVLWRERDTELLDIDENFYYIRVTQNALFSIPDSSRIDYRGGYIGRFKKTDIEN